MTLIGCELGKDKEKVNMNEKIDFEFYPSFIPSSNFNLEINPDEPKLKFKIFKPKSFFDENDTIIIYDEGSIKLSQDDYFKFKSIIDQIDFVNHKNDDERIILDGISGSVNKIDVYGDTATIDFRSPNRKDFKIEYRLIDAFFELTENNVVQRKQIEYVEALKGYFDYGLPIKKTNETPLEYRFWGALTSNEEKELNELLQGLPSDKPVIFDCTNFPGMGNMYHGLFYQLNDEKEIHYLINEEYRNDDLIQIGNCSMFSDRSELMKKLEEK